MNKSTQYQAYNMANRTVGKTRQVVMLYDGMIRFIKQARQAIEENRIEDRFKLITKASDIVVGLQGSLDFEQGGAVARTLHDFYISVESRLMSIHRSQSTQVCDELVKELKQMRDVWEQIDKTDTANASGAVSVNSTEGPEAPVSTTPAAEVSSVQISA